MNSLTLSVCPKKDNLPDVAESTCQIAVSDRINEVSIDWNKLAGSNIFLNSDYLQCLEECPAEGITPFYAIISLDNRQVGIAYFQWKFFHLRENIRSEKTHQNVFDRLKRAVIHSVNFPTLICGNLLLTGKHGFSFHDSVSPELQWQLLDKTVSYVKEYLQHKGKPVGLVLTKDFYKSQKEYLPKDSFVEFQVQPTMNMLLNPSWETFEDYVESMKSKYRVRLKKARKDNQVITKRVFELSDISAYRNVIFPLYENISNQADFNTFILDPCYFEKLKSSLKDNFTFTTYWHQEKMVGFSTTIVNSDHLHAHFLGYDKNVNQDCQLYLNMLYDIVGQAVDKKLPEIDFSRTAIEIKSTVGAKDIPLYLYIKHVNPIWNSLVSPILNLVKPDTDYIIRTPFRED